MIEAHDYGKLRDQWAKVFADNNYSDEYLGRIIRHRPNAEQILSALSLAADAGQQKFEIVVGSKRQTHVVKLPELLRLINGGAAFASVKVLQETDRG